ncbi:MAG: hypothetical protein M3Q62_11445 [Actinomycetota bacterium]|nr:hypothetical protein [Rubrobacteraceae bacterium]MBA3617854.1 hypothetical protein [Rubrobacteraceae bacterium]MDQ3184125.1 hypothetical protein [Actinomycetota bacterium]
MEPSLPPGYHLERDPDLLLLRRPDRSLTAAFSATGATAKAVELAACEDRRVTLSPAFVGRHSVGSHDGRLRGRRRR